ncbi:glycosyltransferase [Roseococcus pinisoli]|uniref:Glycosyltransferase n=1 Tax=Roseococcus pinisoli TaxID=2835040 RepID=A0ABS5QLR3_9PROT|nr:glycosyltransferase [Roseococcus pinisoli]MBS7813798.1 glycosyltransferase [Roseococcus pinisoli]
MNSYSPLVSVIINTYNRGFLLADALRGVEGLRYPHLEIVVVNGPSTDDTEAVLHEWHGRIKLRNCSVRNLSISRNIGIAAAAGEIVAFLDDDAAPHPEWLARLLPIYQDKMVAAVGGYTVDNTGVRYQARKTICDRYGRAHHVSDFFDERPLNRPGTPLFPSLLGTNSTFRRDALVDIGGFDHAFAYLLDETDVCLRLVDAGYRVIYEPTALVFHQFAPSHIRNSQRAARTLYPSAVSKAYFVMRHGAPRDIECAAAAISEYRRELLASNRDLEKERLIRSEHRISLDEDLEAGIAAGEALARERGTTPNADLTIEVNPEPFLRLSRPEGRLRICIVSQGWPPTTEAGIARWTAGIAAGLIGRGHAVHVVTRAEDNESIRFVDGLWFHALLPESDGIAPVVTPGIPPNISAWNRRVRREVQAIKSYGLNILSFPIWDLEGVLCLDDPDIAVVMSLHTTYALALPHKEEWLSRPLYRHFVVDRMIGAERRALLSAPMLLANSCAIVADIELAYGITIDRERVALAPHGTIDLLKGVPTPSRNANFRVLFVGRFESRKGFDLAISAAVIVLNALPNVDFHFAGGELNEEARMILDARNVGDLKDHPRVRFLGLLPRNILEQHYREAEIVLVPSRYESFGLVAIEAMAAGRPVLAIEAGGLAEVVTDGVDGRLIPDGPTVVAGIADALIELGRDRAACERLAAGARRSFETKYRMDHMLDAVESAYRQAIEIRIAGRDT